MRKLILKEGSDAQEYALLETAIIGRAGASTIRLDFNRIEAEHAKISKAGPNTFVEDLDTPQGITVNGKKVSRWALKKGDVIGLGPVVLLYDEDNKPDPPPEKKAAPDKNVTETKTTAKLTDTKTSVKPPDSKAAANGKDHAKPAQGSSTVIAAAAKNSPAPSKSAVQPAPSTVDVAKPTGKTSHQMPAIKMSGASSSGIPAQRPGAKTAVGMPAISHSSSSMMPAGRSVNGKSSPGLGAISPSARLTVGGQSGVNAAVGGKSGFNPTVSSHPRIPVSGAGSESSTRMPASGVAVGMITQRMAAIAANPPAEDIYQREPGTNRKLLVAVSALSGLVLILGVVLIVMWYRSSDHLTSEARQVLDRLHNKSPKLSEDLGKITDRLTTIRRVSDVTDLLGEPDLKFKDEIPLWNPTKGTEHYPGPAFYAYYMADRDEGSAVEGAVTSVMVFMITDDRAELMGPKKYARIDTPPDKSVEPAKPTVSTAGDAPPIPAMPPRIPLLEHPPAPPPQPPPLPNEK